MILSRVPCFVSATERCLTSDVYRERCDITVWGDILHKSFCLETASFGLLNFAYRSFETEWNFDQTKWIVHVQSHAAIRKKI